MDTPAEIIGIKTRYENSSKDELLEYLDVIYDKWVIKDNKQIDFFINRVRGNLDLVDDIDYGKINKNYKLCLYNTVYLQQSCILEINQNDERHDEIQTKFNKIFESIDYGVKILKMGMIITTSHSDEYISIGDELGLLRYIEPNIKANSPLQNLILYLLESIYMANLQRYQGYLYEKILYNGYFTHAWKEKISIKSFIYENTQYSISYAQWHNLTSNSSNIKSATEFLENCQDPRIADLKKDRHVFAFRNGIYCCKEWDSEHESYIDHFYEYASDEAKGLDRHVVASKFFDTDFDNFDNTDDWYEIPTPCFQGIFDYQEFSEEVSRWLYVFVGRLLFNLGDLDNWQVALFLEGVAGSGKSTIIKLIKRFYETCDIGVLSNNIEKKFGLSSLKDKLLYVAPEVKADLGLEQSEFQLMIEGGDMQLPVKYKDSHYVLWNIPGLFAGNEPPDYTDNSGSISRRLVVAKFNKKVSNKDSDLDSKLLLELPKIMKKSASAYLSAVNQFKGMDFWSSLPKYFRDTQQDMAQNTHSLEHFISSGKVVLGEEHYIREKNFVQAFNEHCKECNLERHKFTTDYYLGVFGNYAITIKKNIRMKYPNDATGRMYQGSFIFGVDIINDQGENTIEDDF